MISGYCIVREVENRTFAQPLVDFLADREIPSIVHSDDCGGTDPALGFIHRTQILVREIDRVDAERLLAEYDAAPLEEGWEDRVVDDG